jgi:hypothetical protein
MTTMKTPASSVPGGEPIPELPAGLATAVTGAHVTNRDGPPGCSPANGAEAKSRQL